MKLTNDEKDKLIIELLKSLNYGNSGYTNDRVRVAIGQYQQLIETGIIEEVQED